MSSRTREDIIQLCTILAEEEKLDVTVIEAGKGALMAGKLFNCILKALAKYSLLFSCWCFHRGSSWRPRGTRNWRNDWFNYGCLFWPQEVQISGASDSGGHDNTTKGEISRHDI